MMFADTKFFALACVVLLPVTARAQPQAMTQAKPADACLRQDMVWGWNAVDDKTLIVTDKAQKAYKITLKPGCFDLKWHLRLSFRSFSGFGVSCLAKNDYVIVPPAAGLPPQRCFISDIAAYTPPPVPPK